MLIWVRENIRKPRSLGFDEREGLPFEAYVSAAEHELRRLGEAWTSLPAANDLLAFLREVLQRMIHKQKSKQPAISRWASSVLREKASKLKGLYDDASRSIEAAKSISEHATEHRGELTGGEILYREVICLRIIHVLTALIFHANALWYRLKYRIEEDSKCHSST